MSLGARIVWKLRAFHPFALWLRQNATAAPCFLYGGWLTAWAGRWDTRWTVGQTTGQILDRRCCKCCLP